MKQITEKETQKSVQLKIWLFSSGKINIFSNYAWQRKVHLLLRYIVHY